MKKRAVAVLLIAGMVFCAAVCGETNKNQTDTKSEKELTDAADDSNAKKTVSSGVRIVSVKDVSDYMKIGEYKGISLDRNLYEVTDEDIELEIQYELEDTGAEVKDGTVENGDMVTINFTGTIDGKEFEGGSAEDYELIIGDGEMIDGFEDGIIGMKKGESREVEVTFPEDYYEESVAGKAAVFEITLQKFTRPAELSDEWVAANTEYKTVEEYRTSIREELELMYIESADYNLYDDAWNEVYASSELIEYPEEDIEQAIAAYKKMNEDYIQEAEMEISEFLEIQGMTEEEYEETCREYAEYKVEQNLIVQGIMDAEGLSLEDEETQALKDELVEEYGCESIEELIETYGEQEVNESLALLRVEHFIVDHAEVNEVSGDAANEDYDMEFLDEVLEDLEPAEEIEEESEVAVSDEDAVVEE